MARLVVHVSSSELAALPARLEELARRVAEVNACQSVAAVRRLSRLRVSLCVTCQSFAGNPAIDEEYSCKTCGPLPVVEALRSLALTLEGVPRA